jgi:hypothetical protein
LAGNKIPFSTTERVIITMSYGAIALGSNQPIYEFSCPQVATGSTVITPAYTLITEYGFVGQFIAGNFSFVMKEPAPSGILHNIAGNFRIRRIF